MPALHRKLQRKFQKLIRNWTSQWLTGVMAWMSLSFTDHFLQLDSTFNMHHCQMFPWCTTTAQTNRNPSFTLKKNPSLRKRISHLSWRLASSRIWCGNQSLLPCFPPTSKTLQFSTRKKIFSIHSNYQGVFKRHSYRNEASLLALYVHLSVQRSVLPSLPVSSTSLETTRQTGKGEGAVSAGWEE